MSLGYLKGAHVPSCPVHQKVLAKRPPWAKPAKKTRCYASRLNSSDRPGFLFG